MWLTYRIFKSINFKFRPLNPPKKKLPSTQNLKLIKWKFQAKIKSLLIHTYIQDQNIFCQWNIWYHKIFKSQSILIEILSYSKSILGLDIIDSVASLVQLYGVKTNLNFKKNIPEIPLESNGFEPFWFTTWFELTQLAKERKQENKKLLHT